MNSKGTAEELAVALAFARQERLAVLATASGAGLPEAALMGVAVTPEFEVVFDTRRSTRKYPNLTTNPRVALVIGCTNGVSVQYEGVVRELLGDELECYLEVYFVAFPDAVERRSWDGMTYFVARPKWLRYCDYGARPPFIREFAWED